MYNLQLDGPGWRKMVFGLRYRRDCQPTGEIRARCTLLHTVAHKHTLDTNM